MSRLQVYARLMSSRILRRSILSVPALAVAATSGIYIYLVYTRIRLVESRRMTTLTYPVDSLQNTKYLTRIVNPSQHPSLYDSRSTTIKIPLHRQEITDEELLSTFVKAFFGGKVMGPERVILQTLQPDLVHFSGIYESMPVAHVWSPKHLPVTLPALYTKILGAFQVLEHKLSYGVNKFNETESYVDIGFGNDQSCFFGAHRFSIIRSGQDGGPNNQLTLRFSCQATTGPTGSKILSAAWQLLGLFHGIYSDLLFRESIGEVETWLNQSPRLSDDQTYTDP